MNTPLLPLLVRRACQFCKALILHTYKDGGIGHQREGHPVSGLHVKAVPNFLGNGCLALAGQCGFGCHLKLLTQEPIHGLSV